MSFETPLFNKELFLSHRCTAESCT